jgi:xylulokinase
MRPVLVFDLGTTYFKAALFRDEGEIAALARQPAPVLRDGERWEMAPGAFLDAIAALCGQLREASSELYTRTRAVSFATQTNSFLLLDGEEEPVTPVILWPDARAEGLAEDFHARLDAEALFPRTGVPEYSSLFAAAKLVWLQQNAPDAWSRARRFCLLSDYLTLWFTGQHVTEAGAAGLLGLLDIHALAWMPDACGAIGLPIAWLPGIMRAGTDLCAISAARADALGLPADCRFVVGCLDQYAGAIGAGNVHPGGVSETTGTVLATVRCADGFDAETRLFQGPGWRDGRYFHMAFGSTSANLLEAYRNHLPGKPDFDALTAEAARVAGGANGYRLCDAPERAAPAEMVTGPGEPSRGEAVRAILEGVAEALAAQVAALCASASPQSIRSVGGAARSDVWLRIKAARTGVPMVATVCEEPTSLGAAMLAAYGLGAPLEDLAERWVRTRPPVAPPA